MSPKAPNALAESIHTMLNANGPYKPANEIAALAKIGARLLTLAAFSTHGDKVASLIIEADDAAQMHQFWTPSELVNLPFYAALGERLGINPTEHGVPVSRLTFSSAWGVRSDARADIEAKYRAQLDAPDGSPEHLAATEELLAAVMKHAGIKPTE